MTSGGTESILSAVKASRDYMCTRRGITQPEMVIAESAHAAFFKAAEYFKIRLIKVCFCRKVLLQCMSSTVMTPVAFRVCCTTGCTGSDCAFLLEITYIVQLHTKAESLCWFAICSCWSQRTCG